MAQSSFAGFTQPKRDGGKSSYYSTQQLDESKFNTIALHGSKIYTNYYTQVAFDVASDGSSFVYVLSGGIGVNPNLIKVNKSTGASISSTLVGTLNSMAGQCITYDRKNGFIYVGLSNNGAIGGVRKLNSSLSEVAALTDNSNPNEIKIDEDGNIFIAYNNTSKALRKVSSSFSEIWFNNDVTNLTGVDIARSGNIYTCSSLGAGSKVVRKLTPNGVEVWSNSDIGSANAIAVDSNENVYVIYSTNFRKFDSRGNIIWTQSIGGSEVHVDRVDCIYIGFGSSGYSPIRFDTNGNQVYAGYEANTCYGIDSDSDSIFLSYSSNLASLSRRELSTKIQLK
jgi:hypothetical protein